MEDTGLNTWQLRHALVENNTTRNYFDGVYPCDVLKNITSPPRLIIVNTDPSHKPGKHWLLFFRNNETVEMFDSLGRNLDSYNKEIKTFVDKFFKTVKFTTFRIQPLNTSLCGHYCLYYAYMRCNGKEMDSIIREMPSPQWIKFCVPILYDIPGIVSECQTCVNI